MAPRKGVGTSANGHAVFREVEGLRRLLVAPQVIVFMLIMIPVLLAVFTRPV